MQRSAQRVRRVISGATLGGWSLFWLLTGVASIVVMTCWWFAGPGGDETYRQMIRVSVRCALPLLLLAFTASAAMRLWPGSAASTWLLRNRKHIGLAFSAVMLWQILFIVLLYLTGATMFPPGPAKAFLVSDLIGYTLLLAMTVTSCEAVKARIHPRSWKRLHRTGIFYVWFIYLYSWPIGMYFSRHSPAEMSGYALLWMLTVGAGVVRLIAWFKRRTDLRAAT